MLTLASSAVAVSWPDAAPAKSSAAISLAEPSVRTTPVPVRVAPISRSADRVKLEPKPPEVVGHKFVTAALNVRAEPSDDSRLVDVLDWADQVDVSGKTQGEWSEIVVEEQSLWVHSAYLSEKKPRPEKEAKPQTGSAPVTSALSSAPCATGSDVESGLVANAVAVHRAVCGAFPQVTTYGGVRTGDGGDHGTGQAVDIMIPDSSTGDEIADWVRANASDLGVSEVIWAQHIWTVQRSSEGWRPMEDRGSTTANHYDHVHVSVY